MGYINFDKNQLINLEYSLNKEMVRSNRAGSFSSTTIIGCNTRKYHGLLITPQPHLDNEIHVLLSKIDETVIQRESEFNIGINKYPDTYSPKGHKYIRDFNADIIPSISFRVGGVILTRETMFVQEEERVLIRYTLEEAQSPTRLRLKPFLAFRNIHALSEKNIFVDTKYEHIANGIKIRMYAGYSGVFMQCSKSEAEYIHTPDWYNDIHYIEEEARGYECYEDLFVPGYFEMEIKKGESIIFSAGTQETNPAELFKLYNKELKNRTPRNSFENCLINSAQQFFARKGKKLEIIAGYPWYDRIGRFSFISLPGLTLSLDNPKACKAVIDTMISEMHGPFFPETGRGNHTRFNSADTSLWFFHALQQYAYQTGTTEKIWKEYGSLMKMILKAYRDGTSNGIRMIDNGLLHVGEPGFAATWMNAWVEGKPVTPRIGMPIEINALWYNAIQFSIEAAAHLKDKEFIEEFSPIVKLIEASFPETFLCAERDFVADVATQTKKDWSLRPNMIMAAALPYSPISVSKRRRIIELVRKDLLTPRGLRSLSPRDPSFIGKYQGNENHRESAFHQGTVWPWMLEFLIQASFNLYGPSDIGFAEMVYNGFQDTMKEHGIGTISEVYDADPPHKPGGATSFAASVAAVLRIKQMIGQQKELLKDTEEKKAFQQKSIVHK